ncbi:MAG: hypothetical protein V1926_00145 [Candidatus Peregrinibacteria bacterium]
MRSRFLLPGITLILLALPVLRARAEMDLYQYARTLAAEEAGATETEEAVARFVSKVFKMTPPLTHDEVIAALERDKGLEKVCTPRKLEQSTCSQLVAGIQDFVGREMRVRSLGRSLQLVASGFEMPIRDHPGLLRAFAPKLQSIIRIWQSSNDWLTTPIRERRIRSAPRFADSVTSLIDTLNQHVKDAVSGKPNADEIRSAMVWRYRQGVMAVERGEGTCNDTHEVGDGSELQYASVRWCTIEQDLKNIAQAVVASTPMSPPLGQGEIVLFPPRILPGWEGNVLLWMRAGINPMANDIGLEFEFPLEPLLPSLECEGAQLNELTTPLCKDNAILGGTYPPEPREPPVEAEKGAKLCAQPFSSQGYLCRSLTMDRCQQQIASSSSSSSSSGSGSIRPLRKREAPITLVSCTPDYTEFPIRNIESGVNACQIGGWRTDPPKINGKPVIDTPLFSYGAKDGGGKAGADNVTGHFDCGRCGVDLYCSSEAATADGIAYPHCDDDNRAATVPKDAQGVIHICIPSDSSKVDDWPLTYLVLHELIHAQQLCSGPIPKTLSECCAVERPAYLAQCNAIAEDGNFEGTDITIDECGSVLANFSCWDQYHALCSKGAGTPAQTQIWIDEIKARTKQINKAIARNVGHVATACEQAIMNPDPRVQAIENSLTRVCSPLCGAKFENTIGNNMCYAAQCTEQSLEEQRLLPGRLSLLTEGEAFPWDSETKPDPLIGLSMPIPPVPLTRIPLYRPAAIVQEMDLRLCQVSGLPVKQPPEECHYDPLRQLGLPKEEYPSITGGLMDQESEKLIALLGMQHIAAGVGTRLGTQLYATYLKSAGASFAELLQSANLLLSGISALRFPENMCPRLYGS